jgi:DNA adenine methylase
MPLVVLTGMTVFWQAMVEAHKRGAGSYFKLISPEGLDLYREHGFNLEFIKARRSISCNGTTREVARDVVAIL